MKDINAFTQTYNSLIYLALIPFFALFTKWSFKSWGHNFFEHVVMNAFILAYYNIISFIIFYPLLYLFKDNLNAVLIIITLTMLSFLVIIPYFFKNFYAEHSFKSVLKRFLLFVVLASIFSIILFFLIIIGMVGYMAVFNPEAMKQFAPKPAG